MWTVFLPQFSGSQLCLSARALIHSHSLPPALCLSILKGLAPSDMNWDAVEGHSLTPALAQSMLLSFSLLLSTLSPGKACLSFQPPLNMLEAIRALRVYTWNFTYNLSQLKGLFLIKHLPLCLTFLNTLVHFRVLVIQLALKKRKWELMMSNHVFYLKALFQNIYFKTYNSF